MKISLSSLSTKGLNTLTDRTITVSEKAEYAVVKDHPLLTNLKNAHSGYFEVYGKQTYSGMGDDLIAADEDRDNPFVGIKTILLGYSKIKGYELQPDAIDLYEIFERRGLDMHNMTYGDETTEMDKLIEELDSTENQAKLGRLNLKDPYGILKTGHTKFKVLYLDQTKANAQLRKQESATSLRRSMETALRNYLNTVEAMKELEGWKDLYLELSEVVRAARNNTLPDNDKTDSSATEAPTK